MKTKNYIYISIIGVLFIIVLQTIWMCKTYLYAEARVSEKIDEILVKSMFQEVYSRFKYVPTGTQIAGAPDTSYPKFHGIEYVEEGVFKASHKGVDFSFLSKCISDNLKIEGWNYSFAIYQICGNKLKLLKETGKKPYVVYNEISSHDVPIRIDGSRRIQITLFNPTDLLFEQLGLVLISSLLAGILISLCIAKLLGVIRWQQNNAKMKKIMTYSMIHDIKTPLSTIRLGLGALDHEKIVNDPEKRTKYLQVISTETQHAYSLINRILTISKSQAGKLELRKVQVDMTSMLSKLEENFKVNRLKNVSFENHINCQYAFADEEYLKEIFYNLIDNSIKYSDGDVTIRISTDKVDKGVSIRVRDNGIGISKADQKVIFDKYERASAAKRTFKKKGAPGFGLGLTYVFQVIDAHEGMIGVESELGKYTEFSIFLPDQKTSSGGGDEELATLCQLETDASDSLDADERV